MADSTQPLEFDATLRKVPEVGGWTVFDVPDSVAWFGTGNPVKVVGKIDDADVAITLMPTGQGGHMGPVKAATRKAIGKQADDTVRVSIRAA
ncbi:DUF1905 domain-containing protein [Microbacterium halophytorum]|uniref:DUF1905 domain-containing protein n=1 Tax=Microbacterium halophytorum TaxID=2067568 RepID=UPI000CFD9FE6|nr:DUF1905 domain-containing protein [Microbacterium halophytorum]